MDFLVSNTTTVLEKALTGLNMRQQALSSNLANVDTPGYRRQDVRFEGALQQALHRTNTTTKFNLNSELTLKTTDQDTSSMYIPLEGETPRTPLEQVQPEWTSEHSGFEYRNDGNNVDVEVEMVRVAQNTQRYVSMAMLEGKQFKGLKSVINSNPGG